MDPKEPTIMSAYDVNRPNFIPENAVWNRPKPNVEVELRDYENEVMADFESKRQINLERVENTINPWIKHPGLTIVYRDLLAGGPAVHHPPAILRQTLRRRQRTVRHVQPATFETRLRSGRIIQPEGEIGQDGDAEIDQHPEPNPVQVAAPEPIHVDPTTIAGFIPEFMRVNGNVIEVRAKYVNECIDEGRPIPNIKNPGTPFSIYQEEDKRNQALKDIDQDHERAMKAIRNHRLEIEKAEKDWWKEKDEHVEKVAKCSKIFSNRLGEGIMADVRQLLTEKHFRQVWLYLEARSNAAENGGENQEVLHERLVELRIKKGQQLSTLFEQFEDLIDLCRVKDPEHIMVAFKRCFKGCQVKEFAEIISMQKHLRLSLDELKARLISEEGILKSKEPEPSHPPKRPFTPQHDRSPQLSKPVHLNAVKSSTDFKSVPCEHCGRTGHSSDRCWKKFPELKNSNVPKRPKVHLASSSSDIPNKEKVIKDAHDLVKSAQSHKSSKK